LERVGAKASEGLGGPQADRVLLEGEEARQRLDALQPRVDAGVAGGVDVALRRGDNVAVQRDVRDRRPARRDPVLTGERGVDERQDIVCALDDLVGVQLSAEQSDQTGGGRTIGDLASGDGQPALDLRCPFSVLGEPIGLAEFLREIDEDRVGIRGTKPSSSSTGS